ncbi:MAG: prolipoprotein diacylglyceryl transferase [Proteobacteria bacterium]|nr:prolipoprotein diacylglyceryl transferase [Pseudomonadota bacterium]MBU1610284.1 prolipoprotein diacylglyceryl transferase [Pseudomonadota bacterium]
MHPILLDFGPFQLHTYGLFMALGFLMAMGWSILETKRAGLPHELVPDLTISIILGAVVGGRLLFVLLKLPYFLDHPLEIFMFWKGGLVFSGGLAVGLLVGLWEGRRRKQPFLKWLDCVVPGIALGQAVGRIGCLTAGCCYGSETTVPWAVTFTDPLCLAPAAVALHPTQIYHALSGFTVFAILVSLRDRFKGPGQRTGLYLILFALFRIIIEFYRADFRGTLGPFSVTHATTAILGCIGLWLFLRPQQRST